MLINKLMVSGCCLIATLLCNCTSPVSGVETTNGFATVVATTTTIEGTAPPLSQVYMCDTGYIPFIDSGVGFITSADLDGNFQFARRAGSFQVSIASPSGAAAGMVIEPSTGNAASLRRALEHPGSISGSITCAAGDTLLIYLAGTSHYQRVVNGQPFDFRDVAGGEYRLRIIRLSGTPITILYETPVLADPGKDAALGMIVVD